MELMSAMGRLAARRCKMSGQCVCFLKRFLWEVWIMSKTSCKTYFSIIGDFDLNDLSEILKMKNTGGHNIGEEKQYGSGLYDWSNWEFGTEYIETVEGIEQAELVLTPFISKISELLFIKHKYKCRFVLEQVPIIEEGFTPSLGFSNVVIDFCAKTGTEIDIDLYVNPYISNME